MLSPGAQVMSHGDEVSITEQKQPPVQICPAGQPDTDAAKSQGSPLSTTPLPHRLTQPEQSSLQGDPGAQPAFEALGSQTSLESRRPLPQVECVISQAARKWQVSQLQLRFP